MKPTAVPSHHLSQEVDVWRHAVHGTEFEAKKGTKEQNIKSRYQVVSRQVRSARLSPPCDRVARTPAAPRSLPDGQNSSIYRYIPVYTVLVIFF